MSVFKNVAETSHNETVGKVLYFRENIVKIDLHFEKKTVLY